MENCFGERKAERRWCLGGVLHSTRGRSRHVQQEGRTLHHCEVCWSLNSTAAEKCCFSFSQVSSLWPRTGTSQHPLQVPPPTTHLSYCATILREKNTTPKVYCLGLYMRLCNKIILHEVQYRIPYWAVHKYNT